VSQLTHTWHDYVLIRCSVPHDAAAMATLAQKIEAERRMRDLLEQSDLPQPDHVEYGFTCIRLFFEATKTVVVIDIDDPESMDGTVEPDAPRRRRRHR
jgi:hypothetical protein